MNARLPLPLSHARAPLCCARRTAALVIALCYVAGFFTGAILFGELLLTLHR